MIKATRFFFFDVDTSNCKAMISMIKATRFFFYFVTTITYFSLLGRDDLPLSEHLPN